MKLVFEGKGGYEFERDDYLDGLIHGNEESDGSFELVRSYFIFNIKPKDS